MSWDLNTNVAMVLYQPIDFYAIAAREVSKSIDNTKVALEKLEKELNLCEQKAQGYLQGRIVTVISSKVESDTATKIQKLGEIKFSIKMLAKDLNVATKGFVITFALEIGPVINKMVTMNKICKSYLKDHQEILLTQQIFSTGSFD